MADFCRAGRGVYVSLNKLLYFCRHHISPNIPGVKEVASKHLHKTRTGKKDVNYVKWAAKASCYLSNIYQISCNVDLHTLSLKSLTSGKHWINNMLLLKT